MKSTKALGVTAGLLAVLLVFALAGGGVYLKKQYDRTTFYGRTLINGREVSDETPEQVLKEILETCSTRTVVINEKNEESISGSFSQFGYQVDEAALLSSLNAALDHQKSSLTELVKSLMNGNTFQVKIPYVFDEETFQKTVSSEALKEDRFPSVDSEVIFNEKEKRYEITQEVYGNEMSDEQLRSYVKEKTDEFSESELSKVILTIDIPEDFYILPQKTHDDLEMNNLVNIYNRYVKAKITYVFGSYTESIDWDTIKNWIVIEDGVGSLNEELVYEFVERLAAKYNTRHYDRNFHTSIGTDIVIPSSENDYGYLVYQDGEFSQLMADIESNTEVEREPVYYETGSDYGNPVYYARDGMDDLAGNYVEVNISMQHLWFYRDGQLIVDSDVVTGSVAKNAETKTGVFPLAYKESPSVLVGQDAADGYRTEVQYWMPFYDGQGLHDASWRGAFGGNIYLTSGSHGCVNLPPYAAEMIYYNIEAGMAIVIYK